MQDQPTAWLDNMTPEEQEVLKSQLGKQLRFNSLIYLPFAIVSLAGLFYLNGANVRFNIDTDALSIYNTILVIILVLSLRLYIAFFISYNKEKDSWQKKVIRGKLQINGSSKIFVNNEEIKVNIPLPPHLKTGNTVEAGVSPKSNMLLSIKNI